MPKTSSGCCRSKCCLGTFLYILILLLLLFISVYIIIPVVFKYSLEIQRGIVFPTWYIKEKDYSNIEVYGIPGTKNFYRKVNEKDNITLGVWQIIPEALLKDNVANEDYNYETILKNEKYNQLLYLHGNGQDRTGGIEMYKILRKNFQIFAVDYRSYGDSSKGELNEKNVVDDTVQLYKWLKQQNKGRIFIWGHSLGTGVATQTVSQLKQDKIVPSGLILEAPFTSVTDVMQTHPIIKIFSWLPWFRSTMIDPIIDNGFDFDSSKHIVQVDCPILILHAKDDSIIPSHIASSLYDTAVFNRNATYQGNVTFHLLDAVGYDHEWIHAAPQLPDIVDEFVQIAAVSTERHNKRPLLNFQEI